jgi:hypothetical protein
MTIQEFRDYMASGKPVEGGSDAHMMFHKPNTIVGGVPAKVIKKIEV